LRTGYINIDIFKISISGFEKRDYHLKIRMDSLCILINETLNSHKDRKINDKEKREFSGKKILKKIFLCVQGINLVVGFSILVVFGIVPVVGLRVTAFFKSLSTFSLISSFSGSGLVLNVGRRDMRVGAFNFVVTTVGFFFAF